MIVITANKIKVIKENSSTLIQISGSTGSLSNRKPMVVRSTETIRMTSGFRIFIVTIYEN